MLLRDRAVERRQYDLNFGCVTFPYSLCRLILVLVTFFINSLGY